VPGVIIGGVALGIVLMVINFSVFAWIPVPSWISGLGMCLIYEACASYYTSVKQSHGGIAVMIDKRYDGLGFSPWIYLVLVFAFILSYVVYNRTSIGLNVRAIGSNPQVAKIMAINIPKSLILTGIVCGILIGCAGFVKISNAGRVFSMTGLTSLGAIFQPLATVLLAQVLQRWINIIIAVPICAFFIYVIFNMLTIVGVPSGTLQETVLGCCVIAFGIIAQRGVKGVVK